MADKFKLVSNYKPTGDQPEAIDKLVEGLNRGDKEQVLLGVTGSGKTFIDASRHLVLEAAHPSPLARGAFFGCRHFSRCNDYLAAHGQVPIDWKL